MNHTNHNHNQYNEKLEDAFVEEEEKRLEEIVKKMKLDGRTNAQICHFLSRKASHYMIFMDKYCSEEDCNEYRREE